MLQDVLGVAGAKFQLAQELDELRMEAVHPGVEGGRFPGFPDVGLQFRGDFLDDLFNAPGMDTAVGD